jgi:Zn-dependent protease
LLLVYSDLLRESFALFITFFGAVITALVAGLTFHECSHAFVANRLGDGTARLRGRLSLNPARHLDPAGSVLMLIAGFGWAKPVPVNPLRLQYGPERGRALVAAAGPVSNLLLATLAAVVLHLGDLPWRSPFLLPFSLSGWGLDDYVGLYLSTLIIFNVVLAVFNLIPLSPLDGFAVAVGLLPTDLGRSVAKLEPYGMVILMLLLILPFVTNGSVSLLHEVMAPAINGITELLVGERARALG